MQPSRRPGARLYYDYLPPAGTACGDIWRDLPSGGLLGTDPITGLVVTPACDLSQRKAETITYLPVIPARAYFSTLGALPEVRSRTLGQLKAGGLALSTIWNHESFAPPSVDQLELIESEIGGFLRSQKRSEKQISALERAKAGLKIARAIGEPKLAEIEASDLSALFGSEWEKIKSRIATNSYSSYMHFLPSDEQNPAFSGVPQHSVVLFRYPMTSVIEIFDLAQHTTDAGWALAIDGMVRYLPAAGQFRTKRPLKALSVRTEFLHDLLSRYTSVYSRLGSPDFTEDSVERMSKEMDR